MMHIHTYSTLPPLHFPPMKLTSWCLFPPSSPLGDFREILAYCPPAPEEGTKVAYRWVPPALRTLSIIIDGMDKRKCHVPAFAANGSKKQRDASMGGLRQSVIGVKVHGIGNYLYIFHPNTANGAGSNMTIEVLRRTLHYLSHTSTDMPPVLHLQLDNCGGENKNQFVLGYLSYLVQAGIFHEILLSFLIVGHTHEDIDQHFSVISRKLRLKNAVSLSEWIGVVHEAFIDANHRSKITIGDCSVCVCV